MARDTILITGGTGKFGTRFVNHFADRGYKVIITTMNPVKAQASFQALIDIDQLVVIEQDLTVFRAAELLCHEINELGLKVNHLVNNARSLDYLKVTSEGYTEREDFIGEFLLDVVVPYELSVAIFQSQPVELKTVTNIGSQYGLVAANPALYDDGHKSSPIQYGVSKAALVHLTKELAVRFAKSATRVNCIAYGGVEGRASKEFQKRYSEHLPIGRMLVDDEITGPLEFIIHSKSSSITGQTIVADGGWTIW